MEKWLGGGAMDKLKSIFMFIFVLLSLILLLYLSATVLGFAAYFIIKIFKPDVHLNMPQLFLLGLSISILAGFVTARGKSK
jgi:hypothetical protein